MTKKSFPPESSVENFLQTRISDFPCQALYGKKHENFKVILTELYLYHSKAGIEAPCPSAARPSPRYDALRDLERDAVGAAHRRHERHGVGHGAQRQLQVRLEAARRPRGAGRADRRRRQRPGLAPRRRSRGDGRRALSNDTT